MNKKLLATSALALLVSMGANAQRFTDKLDRGLVAVKTTKGVYCSWRIQADEYYDVKYNLYRDGTRVNAEPLDVSNFTDASGSENSQYTVKAVLNGVEQQASKAATVLGNNYKEIIIKHDKSLKATYEPNDACCADVDGDGEVEILMKFNNLEESAQRYPKNGPTIDGVETKEYSMLACLKQDGTVLWWVNCGPNMGDFQNNEQNIVGYDWDMDGKAEVVMRLEEGSTVHMADGTTYTIGADGKNGTSWKNYREPKASGSVEWFTHYGKEFLWYCEGATGKPYQCIEFPLKRLEDGETDLKAAWGDGYGHRSSKYFFGAPYLDGKHPSIFLGRGIYTRHKFIAYDVDPKTHDLNVRWKWTNNQPGSPWYGQGYHNYIVADVDWDGRDEIVWGSMVIDDNGKGLSTTGLGHGDAQHIGDFNPYVHGQEMAACNEDAPSNNYRDATTSKIYYRLSGGSDDGRSMAGNFTNDLVGGQFFSGHESKLINCVTNKHSDLDTKNVSLNFRIYWDGDLLDETFNGTEVRNSAGQILKYGQGRIESFGGSLTNNDTKSTPCYQGDIFGDWREEVIMRTADNNIRIYTSTIPTEWRNYSLWYDHQYRNAMVWQPCGYNQPPHPSYFLGEKEGITIAPPPLTTTGREVVASSIDAALNGKHALLATTGDATVSVADGASPAIFTDNAPSWVQGTAPSECKTKDTEIKYAYYTHTLTGGAFTGSMRLVKQGDGTLVLPHVTQTYTGKTDVWAGTLQFDGTMESSPVWLNRFAELHSDGGIFKGGITADYGSVICPGGKDKVGTIETTILNMNFGSIAELTIDGSGNADMIKAKTLKIEKKDWENGPEYLAPRFNFVISDNLASGTYKIAEIEKIDGDIKDIILTGLKGHKASLQYADGVLSLNVEDLRAPSSVVWTGEEDDVWNLAGKSNFKQQADNAADVFVSGDNVIFNDEAKSGKVTLAEDVAPATVTFDNNGLEYTVAGEKAITGNSSITKKGEGNVNINNVNTFKGSVNINKGSVTVASLGVADGANNGAFGPYTNTVNLNGGSLVPAANIKTSHPIAVGNNGGTIEVNDGVTLTLDNKITGTNNTLTKNGNGTLVLAPEASYGKLIVNGGTVKSSENASSKHGYPKTVVLNNATLRDHDDLYSYSTNAANIEVPADAKSVWYLDSRCGYTGSLTGSGTLSVNATSTRGELKGNWAQFAGNVNFNASKSGSYTPEVVWSNGNGLKNATVGIYCNFKNSGKSLAMGNLVGSGSISGSGTLTIGYLGDEVKFTGTITGCKIIKTGAGLWTVNKLMNKLSGTTTVNGGVLNLNNSASKDEFFGAYDMVVSGSGTLAGQALLHNIVVNNGGTLKPGNYTSSIPSGALKSASSIFCYEGSTAKFFLYNNKDLNNSHTSLVAEGTFSMDGEVVVETYKNYKAKAGDTFTLWKAQNFSGAPSKLTLPELPAGLSWDVSDLYKPTGVLKVVVATGISHLAANEAFTGDVFTANGMKIGTVTTTKAQVQNAVKALGVADGVYIIRVAGEAMKVIVK